MSPAIVLFLAGFLIPVVFAVMVVRKTRSSVAQVSLALLLLVPVLFCVVGFAATFEPLDPSTQWTYRLIYGVVGLGLAATSLILLIRRPTSGTLSKNR